MTKKEYCLTHETIGTYGLFGDCGVCVKGVEGDYMYD